jgi:hypothetical protein
LDEKRKITTTQENSDNIEEVVENSDREARINNKAKSQKATEEAVTYYGLLHAIKGIANSKIGRDKFFSLMLESLDND